MTEINVIEFSTFYKIPKIAGIDYRPFTRSMSTINYYSQEYVPYGYFDFPTHFRCCKIPQGMLYRALEQCGVKARIVKSDNFSYDLVAGYNMKNQPKDEKQASVIKKVIQAFNDDERVIVSLQTGQGKTYVATNILSHLKVKCIVLVKSNELKKQWLESFKTHTDVKGKDLYVIETGEDWMALKEGNFYDPQIIIATHKSLSIFLDKIGQVEFTKFLLEKKIGMKICDEFDLENSSMFKFDTTASLRYNLYLSATTFKSSRDDNRVFQKIFLNVTDIGKEFRVKVERNGLFIHYTSNPTRKEYYATQKYTKDGWQFDYQKYHAYIIHKKSYAKPLKQLWDKMIKKRYESDATLKTVFFVGRAGELSETFRDDLANLFGLPKEEIAILNSDTPKKDRPDIMKDAELIVSTSKSLGRGIDLKGLDIIVDLETRASESEATQVIGRVSRTGMKNVGTYIQLIDHSFDTVVRNYNNKVNNGFWSEHLTATNDWTVGDLAIPEKQESEKEGIRLIVSGSRGFNDYDLLKNEIEKLNVTIKEIVSGGAKGADKLGERYATEKGIPIQQFIPDWDKNGKRAGILRNTEMAKYADEAIIFNMGTPGSNNMIATMKWFKKKAHPIKIDSIATIMK